MRGWRGGEKSQRAGGAAQARNARWAGAPMCSPPSQAVAPREHLLGEHEVLVGLVLDRHP